MASVCLIGTAWLDPLLATNWPSIVYVQHLHQLQIYRTGHFFSFIRCTTTPFPQTGHRESCHCSTNCPSPIDTRKHKKREKKKLQQPIEHPLSAPPNNPPQTWKHNASCFSFLSCIQQYHCSNKERATGNKPLVELERQASVPSGSSEETISTHFPYFLSSHVASLEGPNTTAITHA